VKLSHRPNKRVGEAAALATEFDVGAVYLVDMPLWWLRLVGRFRLTFARDLASTLGLFALGLGAGLVLGRL